MSESFITYNGEMIKIGDSSPSLVTYIEEEPPVTCSCLCFTANVDNSTVRVTYDMQPTTSISFEYSTNGTTWSAVTINSAISLSKAGDKIYMRGDNAYINNQEVLMGKYYYFAMTGSISASGNIMSILDNGACTLLKISRPYCFARLFEYCNVLTTPPELPANYTYGANAVYWEMFKRCSALTVAPVLPYIEWGAAETYSGMFKYCTSLTVAPALPNPWALDDDYREMFYGCTSLVIAPALPTQQLQTGCYESMFYGCTSLIVSDTQTASAPYEWRLPSSGNFTMSITYSDVFTNCAGTRSSNAMQATSGSYKVYYTQNPPVV